MSRGRASFLWWRVREFALNVAFSGNVTVNGTNSNGAPWSYTQSYSGAITGNLNVSNSAQSVGNLGVFNSPMSSIGLDEIGGVAMVQNAAAPIVNFAWDYPPPDGAPTLPTNYTDNSSLYFSLFTTADDDVAKIVQRGNNFWPAINVVVTTAGNTNIDFRDRGGVSLGTIALGGSGLPAASGYIQCGNLW